MSSTTIDNIIFELRLEAQKTGNYYHRVGADAVNWYIHSGRASVAWIQAVSKASPARLLAKVESARAGCETKAVGVISTYLKRHCGYKG